MFLLAVAAAGLVLITLCGLRLVSTSSLVTLPTTLFLVVYLGSMAAAARVLHGPAKAAACVASVAVLAMLPYCGWALLAPAPVALIVAWLPGHGAADARHENSPCRCSLFLVTLTLRPMTGEDLAQIATWLELPHVARWWTPDTTAEAELEQYRRRIGQDAMRDTIMLTVLQDGQPIGWCQWYLWADYPDEETAMGAHPGEAGIDYAIGDPEWTGRGTGTELISVLVAEIRQAVPGAGVLVGPDAANAASRRVLEKNGFELVEVRPVVTEPSDAPIAIYRLPAGQSGRRS